MKRIQIEGKEYIFEYAIEATLYNECTERIMDIFVNSGLAQGEIEEAASESGIDAAEKAIRRTVSSMADIPRTAVTLFYAGLLEHHGTDVGDGTIKSLNDAKKLVSAYMREHKDENDGKGKNLFDIMNEMMELLVEDSFFEQIGLDKMFNQMNEKVEKATKKVTKKAKPGNN